MAAAVPRRGPLSPVIALVQDTVELHAITVGLRNGFLHFKHTYIKHYLILASKLLHQLIIIYSQSTIKTMVVLNNIKKRIKLKIHCINTVTKIGKNSTH